MERREARLTPQISGLFDSLPNDVIAEIYSFLGRVEHIRSKAICRRFYEGNLRLLLDRQLVRLEFSECPFSLYQDDPGGFLRERWFSFVNGIGERREVPFDFPRAGSKYALTPVEGLSGHFVETRFGLFYVWKWNGTSVQCIRGEGKFPTIPIQSLQEAEVRAVFLDEVIHAIRSVRMTGQEGTTVEQVSIPLDLSLPVESKTLGGFDYQKFGVSIFGERAHFNCGKLFCTADLGKREVVASQPMPEISIPFASYGSRCFLIEARYDSISHREQKGAVVILDPSSGERIEVGRGSPNNCEWSSEHGLGAFWGNRSDHCDIFDKDGVVERVSFGETRVILKITFIDSQRIACWFSSSLGRFESFLEIFDRKGGFLFGLSSFGTNGMTPAVLSQAKCSLGSFLALHVSKGNKLFLIKVGKSLRDISCVDSFTTGGKWKLLGEFKRQLLFIEDDKKFFSCFPRIAGEKAKKDGGLIS